MSLTMLTNASEMAIKALLFLGRMDTNEPTSPRVIAEAIGNSPTYLGKTLNLLVRAGILRSKRGIRGGVWLARRPADINLLQVVEACQGIVVGNYCQRLGGDLHSVCGFHRAMQEVYDAATGALSRWTLASLLSQPSPTGSRTCRMLAHPESPAAAMENQA